MIISFSGLPGAGKSSIAHRLAADLGWPYYDMGTLRRQIAAKKGLTIEEYNKIGENDPSTDTEVDYYQADLGKEQDNFVIVGRTSWHFIPHSLKILLSVRPEISAERVFNDLEKRNESGELNSIAAVRAMLDRRFENDKKRFATYYSLELYNEGDYDWILDTSDLSPEQAYQQVWEYVQSKIA